MPEHHNGRPIYKPTETAYLHADFGVYSWGAALHEKPSFQARSFWHDAGRPQHATGKELRVVRHAM
jgi:hypothetical protein